jgi:hypothetical protein
MSATALFQLALDLGLVAAFVYVRGVAANAAKKRDLDELTRIVKRVEAQYQHAIFVHRTQAQLEIDASKNVWDALVRLDSAVITFG